MKTAFEVDASLFFLKQKHPFNSQGGKLQIKTLYIDSLKAVQKLHPQARDVFFMICNISMAQWSKTLIWRDRGPSRWVVLVNMECVQSSKTQGHFNESNGS